jgi:protein phosphatase
MLIEPHIAKGILQSGDMYLLCSDGLTDMLTNFEISDIMLKSENTEACVCELIDRALEHGGRDNITVIVCKII